MGATVQTDTMRISPRLDHRSPTVKNQSVPPPAQARDLLFPEGKPGRAEADGEPLASDWNLPLLKTEKPTELLPLPLRGAGRPRYV